MKKHTGRPKDKEDIRVLGKILNGKI